MKKNLSIQNSEERNVTTVELNINDHSNTCWIEWDNLNIPRIDAVSFKLKQYKKEQKQTLSFLQNKIKMLQEQVLEETNKLMSLNSIENKLNEVNSSLRDCKNKGIEIMLSTGETTIVDADVLELIDPSDYKLLKVGEIPVAKSNKKVSELAQYHEVNEEVFM
jgi:hypothetical protein